MMPTTFAITGHGDTETRSASVRKLLRDSVTPWLVVAAVLSSTPVIAQVNALPGTARLKDVASLQGQSQTPLVGYGLVVGLNKTGDRRQTIFSAQTLANMLERFGI